MVVNLQNEPNLNPLRVTIVRANRSAASVRHDRSGFSRALEAAGIVFIDQDAKNGPGVRLRDPLP
jgi:hypothetical protein